MPIRVRVSSVLQIIIKQFNMNDKFELIVSIALIVAVIVFFIWSIYTVIILANDKLYCKHYYKKDWDLWEKIIEKLKEQKGIIYVSKFDDLPILNSFVIDIEIDSEKYELIYWVKRGHVSVHQDTECILCGYDKYHSNMAVEIMKEKIKRISNYADEETKRITEELMREW